MVQIKTAVTLIEFFIENEDSEGYTGRPRLDCPASPPSSALPVTVSRSRILEPLTYEILELFYLSVGIGAHQFFSASRPLYCGFRFNTGRGRLPCIAAGILHGDLSGFLAEPVIRHAGIPLAVDD